MIMIVMSPDPVSLGAVSNTLRARVGNKHVLMEFVDILPFSL